MRKLVFLFLLLVLFAGSSANAITFHECNVIPEEWGTKDHELHEMLNGCSNEVDAEESTCEHSNGFYWTSIECGASGCTLVGTVDCPGGDRGYNINCPSGAEGARAMGTRDIAHCDPGNGSPSISCTCSSCPGY